jgi:hypothetical protein
VSGVLFLRTWLRKVSCRAVYRHCRCSVFPPRLIAKSLCPCLILPLQASPAGEQAEVWSRGCRAGLAWRGSKHALGRQLGRGGAGGRRFRFDTRPEAADRESIAAVRKERQVLHRQAIRGVHHSECLAQRDFPATQCRSVDRVEAAVFLSAAMPVASPTRSSPISLD